MVTMLGYIPVPADTEIVRKLVQHLSDEQQSRLAELGREAGALIAPLTQVRSDEDLHLLVAKVKPSFARTRIAFLEILVSDVSAWHTFRDSLSDLYGFFHEVVNARLDLLGEEAAEQFLGALESAQGLNDWAIGAIRQGQDSAYRILPVIQLIADDALAADITITAVLMILFDASDWTHKAIAVLCRAADDYMANVEDVFLERALVREQVTETVSLDAVRERLGL